MYNVGSKEKEVEGSDVSQGYFLWAFVFCCEAIEHESPDLSVYNI